MSALSTKVAAWLRSLDGITTAKPVTLTIGKKKWEGASYDHEGFKRYYLIGDRPACYKRSDKVCFVTTADDREWYVGCYMQDMDTITAEQKQYHPFGVSWCLFPWLLPDAIDTYESKPYKRMAFEVVE